MFSFNPKMLNEHFRPDIFTNCTFLIGRPQFTSTQAGPNCDASGNVNMVTFVGQGQSKESISAGNNNLLNYTQLKPKIEISSSLGEVLMELRNLKEVVVNNNDQHKNIVRRLTEEIISLSNEVRQLKTSKATCMLGDEEGNSLPKFPINSVDELINFEANLQSDEIMVKQLVSISLIHGFHPVHIKLYLLFVIFSQKRLILRCGGDDVPTFIRRAIRKLISDEVATKYSWTGTKSKPSIRIFFLISIIRGTVMYRFNIKNKNKSKTDNNLFSSKKTQ